MKYRILRTTRFKKDYKRAKKRGYPVEKLREIVTKLANGEQLAPENSDHALTGNYIGKRECHITLDWLLIYEVDEEVLYLYLSRTGTHSDLF
ncbi:type II toxin-antitoxin system YafQ family toxin [uncultured Pseudoramibacter sp.]|uniref:type II toxin-antitoxin system YafQ family toxin n=1 Tax=uncultured Pseudoramibacter sp. TaxID=1623493 RepID=UPI0025D7CF28|nr:type II toxin-antitoxin system YafQ family toxin [uncultured Pseudoramibacter sp.]